MRTFALLVTIALPAFVCGPVCAAETPTKPNILFILADDLGRTDVGFMGCKEIRTPHLDKLAAAGAVLDAHYVQPVCSPTRAALMTGRYATHTGVYTIVRPHAAWGLPLEERTLAQALREAGYETAITGKWHLGEFEETYRPTGRGFDHQYGFWFGMIDYFKHTRDTTLDWHRDDQPCNDEGYSTHLIAKEACRRIREKQPDKPLFLYLPFNAVHGPFQVPDSYLAPYDKLTGTRRTYAGMCSAMDEAVGQVVAALEEKGLKQNTLIVFSSDNGGPSPGRITTNGSLRAGCKIVPKIQPRMGVSFDAGEQKKALAEAWSNPYSLSQQICQVRTVTSSNREEAKPSQSANRRILKLAGVASKSAFWATLS
ncbi:MAG: arylsulfatase [Verrucomicrobia bacterium]|nr:arylsulfatase [Verrucomicrobiota bacterium]